MTVDKTKRKKKRADIDAVHRNYSPGRRSKHP